MNVRDGHDKYIPSGELQGDDKSIPSAGTTTGMPANVATEGMDTSAEATNRQGGIRRSTGSDGMEFA
jgi:hypothetical protein